MEKVQQANEKIKSTREEGEAEYQRISNELNREEEKIKARFESLQKKQLDVAEEYGDANASFDDLIEINVGGKIIAAKRGTLCQVKGSRLEALFCGRYDKKLQRDGEGHIFLDVNYEAFQTIVDYLHEMAISPPDKLPELPTSPESENQYLVDHLLNLFTLNKDKLKFDSTIIKDGTHLKHIHNWLQEDESGGKFKLLYRSSRDGITGNSFHSRCDNQGCTLTIIETTDGLVMGGYSNTPWSSVQGWHSADKAFLFVLFGNGISAPSKLRLKEEQGKLHAVYHHADYGPTFGSGHDCRVYASKLRLYPGSFDNGELGKINTKTTHVIKNVEVFGVDHTVMGDSMTSLLGLVDQIQESNSLSANTKDHAVMGDGMTSLVRLVDQIQESNSLSANTKDSLIEVINMLGEAEVEIANSGRIFEDAGVFIDTFACGETKDKIKFNVSGAVITTERNTLQVFPESVLARQFDDTTWTENNCVRDWTPEDVNSWVKKLEGVPDDAAEKIKQEKITGRELLSLGLEGLKMIGIRRPATICLIYEEIKKLGTVTFIEHSPYCFGKLIDFCRMLKLHSLGLGNTPDLPSVRNSDTSRFVEMVKYFNPGDTAELILGVGFTGKRARKQY